MFNCVSYQALVTGIRFNLKRYGIFIWYNCYLLSFLGLDLFNMRVKPKLDLGNELAMYENRLSCLDQNTLP